MAWTKKTSPFAGSLFRRQKTRFRQFSRARFAIISNNFSSLSNGSTMAGALGTVPTTAAMLFEIRELQRTATACKFRYSQLDNPAKKASTVRAWREIHNKKAILKIVCRSCWLQKEAEQKQGEQAAKTQEIPTPPILPQWLIESAIRSALKTCPSSSSPEDPTNPSPMPNPPPMASWIRLQAAKKALRPNSSQKQQTALLPRPPPLPSWVQSMILKETRNKLRHPHNNNFPTYQPPPLPSWTKRMILKQTKNKLRKQTVPRPSIPLSKIILRRFWVSARRREGVGLSL